MISIVKFISTYLNVSWQNLLKRDTRHESNAFTKSNSIMIDLNVVESPKCRKSSITFPTEVLFFSGAKKGALLADVRQLIERGTPNHQLFNKG